MKYLNILGLIIFSFILLSPVSALADGGMIVWPPLVHLDQSAQNAIVAWNGEEEIIILSNDVESDATATALRIIPLPSNPSEIEEGDIASFEKLTELMNEKLKEMRNQFSLGGRGETGAPSDGIEITFQEVIGAHNITVVKVNDLDYFLDWVKDFTKEKKLEIKEIPSEFREGVSNYLKRDIKYFVFDVVEAGTEKESIKPLIYQFDSDFLYYPLKMTAVSDIGSSQARVSVFLVTENEVPNTSFTRQNFGGWADISSSVELTSAELKEVSERLVSLFEDKAQVKKISYYGKFNDLREDIVLYSPKLWEKDLRLGDFSDEIRALQKLLINEEVWDSEAEATGYFGSVTQKALAKFQEKYSSKVLAPLQLKAGTGYFGKMTKDYLKELSVETKTIIKEAEKEIKWIRNLAIGMSGDDVKELQEILIREGVWGASGIGATGYFGAITKEAVIKFQEKYRAEVLEPLSIARGTGFVGFSTRDFLDSFLENAEPEDFCGSSTYGECDSAQDCNAGGCSGQVCESKFDESAITTCEWLDCYNAEKYGISCQCLENKCQWSK